MPDGTDSCIPDDLGHYANGRRRQLLRRLLADRLAVQIDAYTWRRYSLIRPFLPRGPLRALNIGTGGGVETLRLLRLGNFVTSIDVDPQAARRTRARAERWGMAHRHVGLVDHVLSADLDETFNVVLMSEVLEHIEQDAAALERVARWLIPGGRLVLSTPTASYGMLPGDTLSAHEDGGHVRPGYDGPELDAMLARLGLTTVQRIYNCGRLVCWQYRLERRLRQSHATRLPGILFGLASRPWVTVLDQLCHRPSDQITIATKLSRC